LTYFQMKSTSNIQKRTLLATAKDAHGILDEDWFPQDVTSKGYVDEVIVVRHTGAPK
jgi:hypothetical protein